MDMALWLLQVRLPQLGSSWTGGDAGNIGVAGRLGVLAVASAIAACALGIGWLLLDLLALNRILTRLEVAVFSLAVGLNVLSLLTLTIGLLGQLHPQVVEAYELQTEANWPVLAADFDLDALLAQLPALYAVRSVPRFPPVQQDIAVVVDDRVPAEQVHSLILQTGQPLLTDARLFDVYRGEPIEAGKKSLAFSLTFQSDERTLTDKVVARQQNNIVNRLERELGARLRS